MCQVVSFETAKEGLDEAVGLRAATWSMAGDQTQTGQQVLELLGDELRAIVGEELQPFGGWQLVAKALKEGFAEEFADV